MRLLWVVCGLCCSACLSINAKPVDTFPNIVVPAGPPGQLSKVEIQDLPVEVCARQGMTTYCIPELGQKLSGGIAKVFAQYFTGAGPEFKAVFKFRKFAFGQKSARCGKGLCTSTVPMLEWSFDLVREDDGQKPIQVALTSTYSGEAYNIGTFQWKADDESAASLIKRVIAEINAHLSPAAVTQK